MAKIHHNNLIDVVDDIFTTAKNKGIMHLESEEEEFDGKELTIGSRQYINFGTCGYMGLGQHSKLKKGAIELVKRYGTQFSISRGYIKPLYIQKLEMLISKIFDDSKVIVYTSTSTVHQSVIGTLIQSEELIILDQQVHYSVQYACQHAKLQGTTVKMVRHSNYELLETMLQKEANQYKKTWYMIDGVYSMHGDIPDTDRLKELLKKYPKLHLYVDDAHGMGWGGKNGAGLFFDQMGVSERIVLISTLAKGFGCVGGIAIFGDDEMHRKVDVYGGVLSYSHPLSPANVGAAIAAANFFLSDEVYVYQNKLRELMDYLNKKLEENNIPNISSSNTPIYFVGAGNSKVTHNLVHRILGEGIYVNTATFPVVPHGKSGLRFTLTRHNTKKDIDLLVAALAYHLPLAIGEEGDDIERVYNVFKVLYLGKKTKELNVKQEDSLILEEYDTINDIDQDLWNNALADRGNTSHSGMQCIEEVFSNNDEKENNWTFNYPVIKDKNGKLVCTTFFTSAWTKDDVLALENVSKKIEEIRRTDPYYLCSKTLMMGSYFTEGYFLYMDTEHPKWEEALDLLFKYINKIKAYTSSTVVFIGDYEEGHFLHKYLEKEGFARLTVPNKNIIQNPYWKDIGEFFAMIPSKSKRRHITRYVLKYIEEFDVSYKKKITDAEADRYFKLFENVKKSNFAFNFFIYPSKTPSVLSKYDEWEFIEIRLKDQEEVIACCWSYIGKDHYTPLILGLNYDYLKSHHIYKQTIFQIVKRGNDLRKSTTFLGLTADYEKQRYLANTVNHYAYMKVDDTYNIELIESFSAT